MNYENNKAVEICKDIDFLFQKQEIVRYSLAPGKGTATSFHDLGIQLLARSTDNDLLTRFCLSFLEINKAQLYHFPQNIFWDADYLFFNAYKEISAAVNQLAYLEKYTELMLKLLALFGKHSSIKFRYLHDFIYGFDWAKWVKKDIKSRKSIQPFSYNFLQIMYQRGQELELLIEQNDTKYHQLGVEQQFRNPFLFLRDPKEETSLMKQLANVDLIPIKTWEINDSPIWQKNFQSERNKLSIQLGFKKEK
ncbi:MAG: hypothetical protein F6K11_28690 [Leptolyngbya sp. SIO3F4]|nr:hypothetical protein [Leptolyngbya sp. SIO3F4]